MATDDDRAGLDVCAWLADEANAATLYGLLLPYENQHVIAHAHAPYHGPVGLALGRLARVLGDLTTAGEHLQAARGRAEEIHPLPIKAYVLAELAAIEPIRSRARREQADTARELARRPGMAPVVDQLDALLGSGFRDALLTPREAEVTALVAQGLSNAAIARTITLSERTVENHVSRIGVSTGLKGRPGCTEHAGTGSRAGPPRLSARPARGSPDAVRLPGCRISGREAGVRVSGRVGRDGG